MIRLSVSAVVLLSSGFAFAQSDKEVEMVPTSEPRNIPQQENTPALVENEKNDARSWHVGPTIGLGMLDAVRFGVESRIGKNLGIGVSYGFFPSMELMNSKLEISSLQAHVLWYPFEGSFFVGGAIGQQSFKAKQTKTFDSTNSNVTQTATATAKIDVSSMFIAPKIGWNWGAPDGGIIVGMDLGLQIPISNSTKYKVDVSPAAQEAAVKATEDYKDAEKDVKDVGDKIGKALIPQFTLFRIGWLF